MTWLKVNPRAMAFYERLEFVVVGETETHYSMEWIAARTVADGA